MTTLTIDDETANALRGQAEAHGLTLDAHLQRLAKMLEPALRRTRESTAEEFEQWLDDLKSGPPVVASLPADFSRADLYDDHD